MGAFISLPNRQAGIDVGLKIPFTRTLFKRNILKLSVLFPIRCPGFAVSKQHYWEIDYWTTTRARVRKALREHFDITAEYTPVLDHYHRFFELKKRS